MSLIRPCVTLSIDGTFNKYHPWLNDIILPDRSSAEELCPAYNISDIRRNTLHHSVIIDQTALQNNLTFFIGKFP